MHTDNLSIKTKTVRKLAPLFALLIPVTSFADPHSLYGELRYSFNNVDQMSSNVRGENHASRLGVKGSFDEMWGITAFYHWETGVNFDDDNETLSQRFYFAGIKGSMGKLVYGRISTPYKMAGLKIDPFYDTSAGAGFLGSTYGLSGLTNLWTDKSLAFSSAKYGHFNFNAALFIDDSDHEHHDVNLGFTYANKNLTAGVQYLDISDTGIIVNSIPDSSAIRGHMKYTMGAWTMGASLENIDISGGSDQQYAYLSTTYQQSEKLKFAGSLGSVSKVSSRKNGSGVNVGAFYQLFEKTNVSLLYSQVDFDEGRNRNTFSIGVSQKFSFE